MSAGQDKLSIGLERLEKAGADPDLLGAALVSLHGALEDHVRQVLATTPALPPDQQARVLDVTKVQWNELIDLLRLHHNMSQEDALLIRRMNRVRQAVAHGERYHGKREGLVRYAQFVQHTVGATPAAAPPPAAAQVRQLRLEESQAGSKPRQRAATIPSDAPTRPTNPWVLVIAGLFLVVGCVALSGLVRQDDLPLQPLPTMVTQQERIVTESLHLRDEPGLQGQIITILPPETRVVLISDGPRRDERLWVRIQAGAQFGWVDSHFLREP